MIGGIKTVLSYLSPLTVVDMGIKVGGSEVGMRDLVFVIVVTIAVILIYLLFHGDGVVVTQTVPGIF